MRTIGIKLSIESQKEGLEASNIKQKKVCSLNSEFILGNKFEVNFSKKWGSSVSLSRLFADRFLILENRHSKGINFLNTELLSKKRSLAERRSVARKNTVKIGYLQFKTFGSVFSYFGEK